MATYNVIDSIVNIGDGPQALWDSELDHVHLRQGDMDGACGPYSVAMALIAIGAIRRADVTTPEFADGRTNAGKFQREIAKFSGFLWEGTGPADLLEIVGRAFGAKKVGADFEVGTTEEVLDFVVDQLDLGHPVIVGLQGETTRHAALAIGRTLEAVEPEPTPEVLLLDASFAAEKFCSWNNTLLHSTGKGKRKTPLVMTANGARVAASWAISLWKP